MSRYKMHAIEYNLMMTMLKLLTDNMPGILSEYNFNSKIDIKPSYPRDISKMEKPSIIVRKVQTDQYKIGMGNVLGQIFDGDTYNDVSGICHDIMVQFDVVANGNTQMYLITSMLAEDLFNNIIMFESGKMQLYDFTADVNNPTKMGVITVSDPPNISYIPDGITRPNLNDDYISAVRLVFTVIQEIIPKQEYVDLSKWIKIKQSISINK